MSGRPECEFEPRLIELLDDPDTDPETWLEHVSGCESCQALAESKMQASRWSDRSGRSKNDLVAKELRPRPEDIPGYRLLEEIGSGGQGTVYRAIQKSTKRDVALKVIRMDGSSSARVRVERECQIMSSFAHPELVRLYDSGESGELRWLAMELIQGVHLDTWMLAKGRTRRERMAVLSKAARGADVAHGKGILHRDLKPSNVLVDDDGHPTVLDFGLGRTIVTEAGFNDHFTATGGFAGTIAYAAPEQLTGGAGASADVRADVYSLGVLAYLAATEQHPFAEVTGLAPALDAIRDGSFRAPREVQPGISSDLEAVILCAMATERGERYASAAAFADDLDRWGAGQPVKARRSGMLAGAWRKARRRPVLVVASVLGAALMVAGAFTASGLIDDASASRREAADLQATVDAQELLDAEPGMWPVTADLQERCRAWMDTARDLFAVEEEVAARLVAAASGPDATGERERLTRIDSMLQAVRERVGTVSWRHERAAAVEASRDEGAWEALAATMGRTTEYHRTTFQRVTGLVPLRRHPSTRLWEAWHPASGTCPTWNEREARWDRRPGDGLIFVLVPSHQPIGLRGRGIRYLPSRWVSKYPLSRAQWAALQDGASGLNEIQDPLYPAEGLAASEAGECLARVGLTVPTSREYEWERSTSRFMTPSVEGLGASPMVMAEWQWGLVAAGTVQAELVRESTGKGGYDYHYMSQSSSSAAQTRRWIRPVLLTM